MTPGNITDDVSRSSIWWSWCDLWLIELNVAFDVSAYSPSVVSIVWRRSQSPDLLNGVRSLTQVPRSQIGHVYTSCCLLLSFTLGHIFEKLIQIWSRIPALYSNLLWWSKCLCLMWLIINKSIKFQVSLWMLVFSLLQVRGRLQLNLQPSFKSTSRPLKCPILPQSRFDL